MQTQDKIRTNLLVAANDGTSLRTLNQMREELYVLLKNELGDNGVEVYQPDVSRSIDPAIVGTLTVVMAPVLLEKIIDIIVKWRENKKGCTVKITIPVKDRTIEIECNPAYVSKTQLMEWKNFFTALLEDK